jgi:capsular polysaccharide transport system permease protein
MTDHAPALPNPGALPARASVADRAERAMTALRFRPFLTVLGIVTLLAAVYYGLIATPLYVSETQFAIRSAGGGGASAPGGGATVNMRSLMGGGAGGGGLGLSEITSVSEYIHSWEMLNELERRHQLRAAYSTSRLDPFRRLAPDASNEDFLKFYRKMVTVQIYREADLLTVRVRGFDPASAQQVAQSILSLSENFVDGLSTRLRKESLRSAEQDLQTALEEVQRARAAVAGFRAVTDDVDPTATGGQTVSDVSSLETQAAQIRAEINALRTYSQPSSPQVRQAQARLATINAQIAALRASQGGDAVASPGGTGNLSQRVTRYEALLAQRTFAEQRLTTAQTAFDEARVAVRDQQKYVVPIVRANLPQESVEPNRLGDFLMVLLFAGAAYAIVTLAIAGIRDHQGV